MEGVDRRWIAIGVLGALVVLLAGVLIGRSSGDDSSNSPASNGRACTTVFAAGRPTDQVLAENDKAPCTDDGQDVVIIVATKDCGDGTTLAYTDYGWGYKGSGWHTYVGNAKTPPAAEEERCASDPTSTSTDELGSSSTSTTNSSRSTASTAAAAATKRTTTTSTAGRASTASRSTSTTTADGVTVPAPTPTSPPQTVVIVVPPPPTTVPPATTSSTDPCCVTGGPS